MKQPFFHGKRWINQLVLGVSFGFLLLLFIGIGYAQETVKRKTPRIFGATYMTMSNPYFQSLNDSIRESVEAQGDILITRDPAQNQERQNEQIRDMIREGMTVLFANPVDWEGIAPALEDCRKAGVVVFAVDTSIKDESSFVAEIQSDQYSAGRLIAQDMKERYPDGASIIALYDKNISSTVLRFKGFKDAIREDRRYAILDQADNVSELETANKAMDHLLAQHPDVNVVFGANDPMGIGALASIQAYRDDHPDYQHDILVYGIDGSPDAKDLILKNKMTGTAVQYPVLMGRKAVNVAYDYLRGKTVQKHYDIQVSMVTKKTLDLENVTGWQ